jgi:hypothetical protein
MHQYGKLNANITHKILAHQPMQNNNFLGSILLKYTPLCPEKITILTSIGDDY